MRGHHWWVSLFCGTKGAMENAPSLSRVLQRGFMCRCPACGEGRLFRAFLKVKESCDVCGEELHHHRADDFPAYLVVALTGHVLLSMALWLEVTYHPEYWVFASVLFPIAIVMIFGLLQPVKGAVVAVQWHIGMDGFAPARGKRALLK